MLETLLRMPNKSQLTAHLPTIKTLSFPLNLIRMATY